MDTPPRRTTFGELDFSQFHDLMHVPFTPLCRSLPGGVWRHVRLWWTYMGWPWLMRQTRCRVWWHSWRDGWHHRLGAMRFCQFCCRMREP